MRGDVRALRRMERQTRSSDAASCRLQKALAKTLRNVNKQVVVAEAARYADADFFAEEAAPRAPRRLRRLLRDARLEGERLFGVAGIDEADGADAIVVALGLRPGGTWRQVEAVAHGMEASSCAGRLLLFSIDDRHFYSRMVMLGDCHVFLVHSEAAGSPATLAPSPLTRYRFPIPGQAPRARRARFGSTRPCIRGCSSRRPPCLAPS